MRVIRFLLLLLVIPSAWAEKPASLLDFELRSLQEPERHSLERYRGAPMLMMFFEPGCSWCFRQFRVLNKLASDCGEIITPVALGVNGSRRELTAEYRKAKPAFPTYQASNNLLDAIGGVPATPFTLVADSQGKPLGWLRGFIPEENLKAILDEQLQLECKA